MTGNQKALLATAGLGIGLLGGRQLFNRKKTEDFTGSVVFITGGSRGLGLALAIEFAASGAKIAICARDQQELEKAKAELQRRGAEVEIFRCDITDRSAVESALQEATRRFGRVDVLVNNAGVIAVGPVENMEVADFEEAMNTMYWGTVYATLAVLPAMLARRSGRIVNITSIGGKVSVPHMLPYTCAKFAAIGFSEGLRAELHGKGVTITTIAPGLMRTGSHLNAFFKGQQDAEATWFALAASAPGLSMSATRAAREIVTATRRGEGERILSAPAKTLARVQDLMPGVTAEALGLAARVILPAVVKNRRRTRGRNLLNLRVPWMRLFTFLGRMAARRLLQPGASAA